MDARTAMPLVLLLSLGCSEPSAEGLEVWTPADHTQETVEGDQRGAAPDAVDADPRMTEIRAATSLFNSLCASCHGQSGMGDGPGRPPVAQVPDFTSPTFQREHGDEELAASIRDGRGGFMPAFGDRLSPEGVAALVRHVRRFAPTADAPAVPAVEAPSEGTSAEVAPSEPPAP